MVVTDLLLLTLNEAPSSVTLAGVEGEENVGRVEEEDDAGAWTVICKHLKIDHAYLITHLYIDLKNPKFVAEVIADKSLP